MLATHIGTSPGISGDDLDTIATTIAILLGLNRASRTEEAEVTH